MLPPIFNGLLSIRSSEFESLPALVFASMIYTFNGFVYATSHRSQPHSRPCRSLSVRLLFAMVVIKVDFLIRHMLP